MTTALSLLMITGLKCQSEQTLQKESKKLLIMQQFTCSLLSIDSEKIRFKWKVNQSSPLSHKEVW
ncbi:hypothetical protein EXN66_Car002650 [Channa argus]|uniref:Uncharacterized protein n=1 Tax=Channa argus TaxID=215402 RepID=A0A6G1PAB7_CHAAH|nr:hypothetical protein EXN66_Car002650 [Channa argus]